MNSLSANYIDYQQVEKLLKSYSALEALINSLYVELRAAYVEEAKESDSDVIYALVIGNRRLDGMPKPPHIFADKTCNVAFIYKQAAAKTANARIKQLSWEILQISMVLEKLDIAIESLDEDQRRAIERFYRSKKYIAPSSDLLEERRLRRDKRKALENMAIIMRLPQDVYHGVMEKISTY